MAMSWLFLSNNEANNDTRLGFQMINIIMICDFLAEDRPERS